MHPKRPMWIAVALSLAVPALAASGRAGVIQEVIDVPVAVSDIHGRETRQTIKVTIFRDDARARSPFILLNHGRASAANKRATVMAASYAANARYLVEKGFTVFFPVRVGYGASGGPDVENSGACRLRHYPLAYEAAVQQSLAVIDHAKTLPYIDPTFGIVMGQSFGGATAIALAARRVAGVRAAVNFAGGGGGRPDTHPGDPCSPDRMTALLSSYGRTAHIPTLWLYSLNDRYWGQALPRAWHAAFSEQGGKGAFVALPPHKADGHGIFTGNPVAWKPAFETFLQSCGAEPSGADAAQQDGLSDTPLAFTTVLERWAAKHEVKAATIVVRRNGRVVHQAGLGGADPAAPVLLASLSKAITGACVATLVQNGRLGLDWPLSRTLAKFIAANGAPADKRLLGVTVSHLLTHRAGFSSSADGEDHSTGTVLNGYLKTHQTGEPPKPAYLAAMLQRPLLRAPGKAFAYSNANYLVLGAVIEEATGQAYEAYCRDAVLQPAGVTATLDPTWRVMWAFGGWRMRGADYLAFFDALEPGRATFGTAVRDWMLDRTGKLISEKSSQRWYSLGLRMLETPLGTNYWHTGSWRRRIADPDAPGRFLISQTSTLAVHVADGTSWFVHSTPLVLDGARLELDRELHKAHQAVRRWQ